MKQRRIESLVILAVLLIVNFFTLLWLQGQPFTTAWASRLAQTGGAAGVNAIPSTFSYQGTLRMVNGSLANGNFALRLRIYDQPIGGNTLHDETFNSVVVRDGLFTVVVGDAGTPLGATVFNNAQLYLGITVNTDSELTPRQRIHPVPWAMQASTALSAVTANTLAQGGGVPGSVAFGAGGAKEIAFPDGGKITDSATGMTISGGGANKAVTIDGNWNAGAILDKGDSNGSANQRSTYPVNIRRYVVEAPDNSTSPDTVPVDDAILTDFCQDEDGCSVWLYMRDWNPGSAPGLLAGSGPFRMSLAAPVNNRREWQIFNENPTGLGAGTLGTDNDNAVTHALNIYNDCFLTDGEYINGQGSDGNPGFGLLNWHTTYTSVNMTCVLILED